MPFLVVYYGLGSRHLGERNKGIRNITFFYIYSFNVHDMNAVALIKMANVLVN